ncbi:MAG: DUF1565 domain-containing protein [Planctomycetota bacterium]|nr:DUF1565 domain-containing protein [Planctomycetota bacterium]
MSASLTSSLFLTISLLSLGCSGGSGGSGATASGNAPSPIAAPTPPTTTPPIGDFYVAQNGDDSAAGTKNAPFASLERALSQAGPGDLIYLRGGNYFPNKMTRIIAAGTATQPIVIRSFPGELPVINGRDVPEGNIEHASTPTWLVDARHLKIVGPLTLTNGRGAGLTIDGDSTNIVFEQIESSYNGQTASRGAHGFYVAGSWANVGSVHFLNCDAHHNANHRVKTGENVVQNQFQHGDGWRIMGGDGIRIEGCRAWYNMDDNYDFTQAQNAITVIDSWAAYAGIDDAQGSITGNPASFSEDGQGFKIGYDSDVAEHLLIRAVAWKNKESGFYARGGRYTLFNAISYQNGALPISTIPGSMRGFYFPPDRFLRQHTIHNSLAFDDGSATRVGQDMTSSHNSWDLSPPVTASDFLSLDDTLALGPRQPDGSLPQSDFLQLAPGSHLIDAGKDVGQPSLGAAPDIGAFESQ